MSSSTAVSTARGPAELRAASRAVKAAQIRRTEAVRDPAFLERIVLPHLPATAGTWQTEVIQLDGSGAATVRVARGGSPPVFAKVFPGDDGPAVYEKLRAFRAAGFGAGSRYQAVEPLGWYPEADLLLCRGAPGVAVSDLVHDEAAFTSGVAAAGAWLGRFHTSGLAIGAPKSLLVTGELLSLAKRLAKVVVAHPEHLDPALEMIEVLDELSHDTVDGLLSQSHGQYRPIHVFVRDDTVTVIDLDRSSPADPARDVAEFLHRMRLAVHSATGNMRRADGPTSAFLAAYADAGDPRHLTNLRFHWARYIAHSLTRKVKTGEASPVANNAVYALYRGEFDRVAAGRAEA